MTPLASTPQVAPKPAPAQAQGRNGGGREPSESSFAQALERSATATDAAGADAATSTPAQGDAGDHPSGTPQRPAGSDAAETAETPDPGSLAWMAQAAAPEPVWPPLGLAGLRLSGTGEASPEIALAGGSMLAAGRSASPVQALPAMTLEAAVATALPSAATEAGAAVEAGMLADAGAAPQPTAAAATLLDAVEAQPAFALPALAGSPPQTARDAAPLLAPPPNLPTPDTRAQDFGERFGAQLHWMAEQNIGHARIRVSPQELGPVEVMLRLDGDRISADFISAHADTRQALEQGLPRLRDLLGEHGFQLAHADVGSQGSAPRQDGSDATGTGRSGRDEGGESATGPSSVPVQRVTRGLLDAYA